MTDFEMIRFKEFKGVAQKQVFSKLNEKRVSYRWTPFDEINRDLLYAVVMGEDASYFEHNGINYDALINAFAENIKRRKFVFGASTISQQVVKNVFLYSSKTITRKLKELIITRRMDERFTKNEILEIYLNSAEFGPDIFGVYMVEALFQQRTKADKYGRRGVFGIDAAISQKISLLDFPKQIPRQSPQKEIKTNFKDMFYKELISPEQYREGLHISRGDIPHPL